MEAGRQQTVGYRCATIAVYRVKAKKSPYIISIREGTQGEHARDLLRCVLCAAESCLLGLFYNCLGSIYDIDVIFFGPRGGHGPPWPPFSSASGREDVYHAPLLFGRAGHR
jgi:hypothetical protein